MNVLQLHSLMLRDHGRMEPYARAIRQTVRPGDVVLDLTANRRSGEKCRQSILDPRRENATLPPDPDAANARVGPRCVRVWKGIA